MGAPEVRSTPTEDLSERIFRELTDAIPHMVWSTRPDGLDDYYNRRVYEYTGLSHAQLEGRRWLAAIVHPEDLERCETLWNRALAEGSRYEIEYRLRRHDGAYLWQLGTAEPLREGNRIVRWFGTLTDIDARKKAEQQVEESRLMLERALRENEERVVEATETVRQLMNRLVHAQEAERHKLAGDLHDLIGQKLTALGINLEFVRQRMPQAGAAALAPRLHQMSTLLEETIGAIREVMSDLRPQALDEHGLTAALYQYAAAFEARTGLRVQVNGADKSLPLPRDIAIALFRIAQEALTNAAKHSGASRVVVRVRKSPERVELDVEDDGHGLGNGHESSSGSNGGWGLRMMRERAEAAGGQLRLENTRPGVRVAVTVPLGHADQRHSG